MPQHFVSNCWIAIFREPPLKILLFYIHLKSSKHKRSLTMFESFFVWSLFVFPRQRQTKCVRSHCMVFFLDDFGLMICVYTIPNCCNCQATNNNRKKQSERNRIYHTWVGGNAVVEWPMYVYGSLVSVGVWVFFVGSSHHFRQNQESFQYDLMPAIWCPFAEYNFACGRPFQYAKHRMKWVHQQLKTSLVDFDVVFKHWPTVNSQYSPISS